MGLGPFARESREVDARPFPSDLRTWVQNLLQMTLSPLPFSVSDWPVPKGAQRVIDLLSFIGQSVLFPIATSAGAHLRRMERTTAASMQRQEATRMERTAPGVMRRIDE